MGVELLNSIILGAVQGLTEFVPVSSSGHLVLVREFLGLNNNQGLAFDAVLHLATAFAILVYFWKEIINITKTAYDWTLGKSIEIKDRNLLIALLLGTIPTALVAYFFEEFITGDIREPVVVAVALIAGSIVFWVAEQVAEKNRELTPRRGFLTGIFQIFSLIPGISRSGITISGGLFLGLNREMATKFSFLLGLPIILASGLKKAYDLGVEGLLLDLGLSIIVGSITAFIFGLLSIKLMIRYLKNHTLMAFVIYRIVLAVIILFVVL
jgi:undecaprenyl-diphosphatase